MNELEQIKEVLNEIEELENTVWISHEMHRVQVLRRVLAIRNLIITHEKNPLERD